MMLLPYPLLTAGLALMWLLLTGFTPGQLLLAAIVSVGAGYGLKALGETSPRVRRWLAMPELFGIVCYDIVRSNVIQLRVSNPSALAILAIVLTSTPGTAWLDYNAARGELLIHVFDLVDEAEWVDIIANRYERLLLEMFE